MRRTTLVLALALAIGIAFASVGDQALNAQEPVKRTVLLKRDLPGMEGKEVLLILVEIAPGAADGKHWHHGHEFGYIMEGTVTFDLEGKMQFSSQAGDSLDIPPKQVHDAKNTGTYPAKALVFVIHEKGKPIAVPVK